MNLWIVTVNFGDTKSTESLIDSVSKLKKIHSIRIGIADNAASIKSSSQLNKILNQTKLNIQIFSYKRNLYYWSAAKKVINNLKDSLGSYPDWIIICNNDIVFPDRNFISQLEKINAKKYPIVGPNVTNSDGILLNPFMINPMSRLENIFWKLYFISYPTSIIMIMIKKLKYFFPRKLDEKKISTNKTVYAVHGSAILFSNYFFNNGGWIDDNFEMYGEELTVAEIAIKLNFPITYWPELKIVHHEHTNTQTMDKRLLYNKAKKSYKYFLSVYKK